MEPQGGRVALTTSALCDLLKEFMVDEVTLARVRGVLPEREGHVNHQRVCGVLRAAQVPAGPIALLRSELAQVPKQGLWSQVWCVRSLCAAACVW